MAVKRITKAAKESKKDKEEKGEKKKRSLADAVMEVYRYLESEERVQKARDSDKASVPKPTPKKSTTRLSKRTRRTRRGNLADAGKK
jgi:hypothetical protein